MSIEGSWASIATSSSDTALAYRLDRYYLSDIFVKSDNTIIAVGSMMDSYNIGGRNDGGKAGVVLISKNKGKDWSVVYRSNQSSEFTSIVQLSISNYLIVGTNGEVVSLIHKY